jgi:hypothetical protein
MGNTILGESLKSILNSFDKLYSHESTERQLAFLCKYFQSIGRLSSNNKERYWKKLFISLSANISLIKNLKSKSTERSQMIKKVKSYKLGVVNKANSIFKNIESLEQESSNLIKISETKEIRLNSFMVEYETTRKKLAEQQAKNRKKDQELLCKICRRTFQESSNYNWSCSIHSSEWNGIMYWCCGQKEENSIGCSKAKHIPDIFVEEIKEEDVKQKSKEQFCISCKEQGHLFSACRNDPNNIIAIKLEHNRSASAKNIKIAYRSPVKIRKASNNTKKTQWNEIEMVKSQLKFKTAKL